MRNYAGNTPMADITYKYNGKVGHVYAKLEYYNPSGSIKDRIASYIIDEAAKAGELKPGQPIVETTSGNTGIALASYGALTGHEVHIFMPDWASRERIKLMEMYGATVHLVSREENGFLGALEKTAAMAKEINAFVLDQFRNRNNFNAHYNTTAVEILTQVPSVTDFISGVGSGGTIMGIGTRLSESGGVRVFAIEPDCARLLSGQEIMKPHKIEGIGDDFIPELFDRRIIDGVLPINDDDAVAMSAKLARELGLGVGISSGANFLGAVLSGGKYADQRVATVFADDNKKYLSTVLADSPSPTDSMISGQVELLDCTRL